MEIAPGWVRRNHTTKYPFLNEDGEVVAVCGQARQWSEAMQSRVLLEARIDVLQMLASGRSLGDVFGRIISLCEGLLEGT